MNRILGAIGGAATLLVGGIAHATSYSIVTLDAPDPGELGTAPASINDHGQIAGFYVDPSLYGPLYHAFTVQADGSGFQVIDRPGYLASGAAGIDNAGDIVGVSVSYAGVAAGFIRSPGGVYSTVDPNRGGLTSVYSEAIGINNHGTIVGYYDAAMSAGDPLIGAAGYIDQGGVFTTISVPGSFGTEPVSINDAGIVSGLYIGAGYEAGFLYDSTTATFLPSPAPPGSGSYDYGGIDDLGQFIADREFSDPSNITGDGYDGYIYSGGVFTAFAVPGAKYTDAYDINHKGQIVGLYIDQLDQMQGFSATPVPEPGS